MRPFFVFASCLPLQAADALDGDTKLPVNLQTLSLATGRDSV